MAVTLTRLAGAVALKASRFKRSLPARSLVSEAVVGPLVGRRGALRTGSAGILSLPARAAKADASEDSKLPLSDFDGFLDGPDGVVFFFMNLNVIA